MNEKLEKFFITRDKELTIEVNKARKEKLETGVDIAFEHYWGRRAELKFVKNQLEELFKEV